MRILPEGQRSCPVCKGTNFLFEQYQPHLYGEGPFLRGTYHSGSNHMLCIGQCDSNSGCPYCSRKREVGFAVCVNRECRRLRYEAIRDTATGEVTLIKVGDDVGPIYLPQSIGTRLSVVRRG